MVSGMYLGEITRNILLHLIDAGELFDGYSSEVLNEHYGFDAEFVSTVEGAKSDDDIEATILRILKVPKEHIRPSDLGLVSWAVGLVAHRACYLAATAIAAVILHTAPNRSSDDKGIDVGVDGSVAQYLPRFDERVHEALAIVLTQEQAKGVTIGLAKDGSGVGAALTALQAKKIGK